MQTGDIEHSELPDNLLHEPKGASTAGAGTVYVADGAGSGSFKKLPIDSLDFAKPSVADTVPTEVVTTVELSGAGLTQPADGVLADIPAFINIPQELTIGINKNASELLRLYNNQLEINRELIASKTALETKLNELLQALKGVGIINE